MHVAEQKVEFRKQMAVLGNCDPDDWGDIAALLGQIRLREKASIIPVCEDAIGSFASGAAFLTFSYGIDGVSIEIVKCAHALNALLPRAKHPAIHLIGGSFKTQASSILDPAWHRTLVEGIDGWDKWDGGKWFSALFRRRMRSHSAESNLLVKEIFRQALSIASTIGHALIEHGVALVIPVNIASNPGNMALTLGLVLASEILGMYVLNINHDFYWEGGKPDSERDPEDVPGVRDHFFRNRRNRTFFSLFKALYPWNGSRWLQVNINSRQSRMLIDRFGLPAEKVFEISTYIDDGFFKVYNTSDVIDSRLRMAHILSDGDAIMRPVPIDDHLSRVSTWMGHQQPVILGARAGLSVDPRSEDLIVLLQPTRIVRRKRIERNFALIDALLRRSRLREEFERNPLRQLILHITGPTPKEHQSDLERVLRAYRRLVRELPGLLGDRIFVAFSVGREAHPSFAREGFKPLTIDAIYRIADAVVFPSETEGRGLPIIEASACGIPIICSQYHHREVFAEVVGEGLPEDQRILYMTFPQILFSDRFLSRVAAMLLDPAEVQDVSRHNREAVRARYSRASFQKNFQQLLENLCGLD